MLHPLRAHSTSSLTFGPIPRNKSFAISMTQLGSMTVRMGYLGWP